jgi:hypothetical protein
MNIITAYPVMMNGKVVANRIAADTLNYSSADGDPKIYDKLTPAQITSFQKFANSKGAKLGVDGKKGPMTAAAWKTYGEEWYKIAMGLAGTLAQGSIPDSVPAIDTSKAQQEKMAKLGLFLDKAKGVYTKGKELGLFDGILNRLGLGGGTPQDQTQISTTPTGEVLPPPPPMSMTTKILLGVGGAIALIAIIVVVTKSNGKGK